MAKSQKQEPKPQPTETPKTEKFAAYVMRLPGTTSSSFRRTVTEPDGTTVKFTFAPGVAVGVTASQAAALRDDIAKGVLAPCVPSGDGPPVVDDLFVDAIKEEYDAEVSEQVKAQLDSVSVAKA